MIGGRVLDRVLEGSVVGSFSRLGYVARSRSGTWLDLDSMDLTGRTIAITGPTSGLGLATARTLRRLGADVILIARNAEKLSRTSDELRGIGSAGRVHSIVADMGDLDSVRRAGDELAALGSTDVLIHNAGTLIKRRQISPQGIEMTIAYPLVQHLSWCVVNNFF